MTTDRTTKAGMGPGALIHIGNKTEAPLTLRVIDYNLERWDERLLHNIDQCRSYNNTDSVTWIDLDGIHDPVLIERIGVQFDIHILVLEDILNSTSRPKVEDFDDYTFVTLKMLDFKGPSGQLNVEHFSMLIGKGFLLTFQERPGDDFDEIRERIKASKGRVRGKDSEYLAYLILDVIVDNYIRVSERFLDRIQKLEEIVLKKPNEFTLHSILSLQKELLDFKRSVDPLKEALNTMQLNCNKDNRKYFRDVYDHLVYESENLQIHREMLFNLQNLHHSILSMKSNSTMKVFTIITTIFVPLTFVAGVYGMNFDNMPELRWEYGYYTVLGGMGLLVIGMLIYFRKQKWM